ELLLPLALPLSPVRSLRRRERGEAGGVRAAPSGAGGMTGALLAEFEEAEDLVRAVQALRLLGYRGLETYSPFPVPGVEERIELPRPRLARYVFAGGVLGAVLGYGIQWYADVWDYPQNVGGRPIHAVAAFVPVTFEAAVLCAALVAFFGLLLALGLPR